MSDLLRKTYELTANNLLQALTVVNAEKDGRKRRAALRDVMCICDTLKTAANGYFRFVGEEMDEAGEARPRRRPVEPER